MPMLPSAGRVVAVGTFGRLDAAHRLAREITGPQLTFRKWVDERFDVLHRIFSLMGGVVSG